MALNFMQTIKGERISKGRVLHQVNKGSWIKCYKNAIKDGAEKIENVGSNDIVSRNMAFFSKESSSL